MKKYKKLLVCILLILSIVGTGVPATADNSDYQGHWAQKQISEFIKKDYISLYSNGTFKPDNNITKKEFIDVVNNFFALTGSSSLKAATGENDTVTRAEAVSTIVNLLNISLYSDTSAIEKFKDVSDIPENEKSAVNTAVLKGIVSGFPNGTFKPLKPIKRSEVVTILYNSKKDTSTTSNSSIQEFHGYLIDACCSDTSSPEKHTKSCNLMSECAESGYGIDVKQPNGTYKFYKFDVNGHKLAADILKKTEKNNNLTVVVKVTLEEDKLKVIEIAEEEAAAFAEVKSYRGWLEDVHCSKMIDDPSKGTKVCLLMKPCATSGYGLIITQDDGTFKFIKFDEAGSKLARTNIIDKTQKESNLTVVVNGILNGDTLTVSTIEEEQELAGILLTKGLFANGGDPSSYKRDEIAGDSEASGYGVAVKQTDNSYKFYEFDAAGNKTASSILQWYIKWADNVSSIPVLVQGVVSGNTVKTSRVLRERPISGVLSSVNLYEEDKAIKDITKADLLTAESVESGYGYYVQSCGGHEFFKFDEKGNKLAKSLIEGFRGSGNINIKLKGYWYWIGNTIKVTGISKDEPDKQVEEEINGVIVTRSYYKGEYFQKNGAPGTITKDFLLASDNAASGYGIIYNTCCGYGYLRLDEKGTALIKDFIKISKSNSNLRVIIKGIRDEDTLSVTSVIAENDQIYKGTLKNSSGYGISVIEKDGTEKFYKFDSIGHHYRTGGGQAQGKALLEKSGKDSLPVNVTGTLEDGNILKVTSISEASAQ